MEIISPGKLDGKSIDRLELEQVADGVKVTIFYKHNFLENPSQLEATLFLSEKKLMGDRGYSPTISDYFLDVAIILGLDEGDKNVDWNLCREIPDDYLAAHPECQYNPLAAAQAPGRTVWVADCFR